MTDCGTFVARHQRLRELLADAVDEHDRKPAVEPSPQQDDQPAGVRP